MSARRTELTPSGAAPAIRAPIPAPRWGLDIEAEVSEDACHVVVSRRQLGTHLRVLVQVPPVGDHPPQRLLCLFQPVHRVRTSVTRKAHAEASN